MTDRETERGARMGMGMRWECNCNNDRDDIMLDVLEMRAAA